MGRFFHPFRHYWPLEDHKTVVWSPNLAETVAVESPDLWPLLRALRSLPEPLEPSGDLQLVAGLLERQGYLLEAPVSGCPEPQVPDGVTLWKGLDLAGWAALAGRREGRFHLFAGDGQGHGWCLYDGDACLDCQTRRWLANRGLSRPAGCLRRVAQVPVWEPLTPLTLHYLELAQRHGRSLVWEGEKHRLCRPAALPGCPCQGWPAESEDDPLGVICQTHCNSNSPPLWAAHTGEIALLGGADPGRSVGAGCHEDSEQARRRALGETLERYSARWLPPQAPDDLPKLRWREFSARQLRQSDFAYAEDSPLTHWCQVEQLGNGQRWRAPSQAVMLCPVPGERSDYPDLSHGLACHETLEAALENGLWECLERDAVAGWWAQLCSGKARGIEREPGVYQIPCLAGYCAVAFALDENGRRACGTAAGPDPTFLARARREAAHNFRILSEQGTIAAHPRPTSFRQHMESCWAAPERFPIKKLERMGSELPKNPADQTPQVIGARLAAAGIHLYWTELTTADVRAGGHRVVKVFSPQLLYLPAQHDHWPLGRARYRELTGHNQLPALPHPFG